MAREKLICNYDDLSLQRYDLNLALHPDEDAVVVGGGCVECGANYRIERTGFKYHVIEFVSAGEGTLVLHGKSYSLNPGTLFLHGPRIPHKIWTDPDHLMVKYFVIFTGDKLIEMAKATGLQKEPLHAPYPLRIITIFKSLLSAGAEESLHRDQMCVLLLKQLILYIHETAILPKASRSPAWQTYLRVREYMEQNFMDLGSRGQVARECHIGKDHLCHIFRRYSHETPLQLLTRLKMRRAADRMLADPTLTIKQVADETGYPDPYYFSRVFKRVFGISPRIYIETFLQDD